MPRDMYACAMRGSMKFVNGDPGFVALSASVRRRSPLSGAPFCSLRRSTGFSSAEFISGAAGGAAVGPAGVDLDVDVVTGLLEYLFERLHISGRNAAIFRAEVAEDR